MPTQVGIHAFALYGTARRGWRASAHHDDRAVADPFAAYFNADGPALPVELSAARRNTIVTLARMLKN